jgi:hypothetical protein
MDRPEIFRSRPFDYTFQNLMNELVIYLVLFAAISGHCILAGKMEKNDWKLKALVFPGFFWWKYQKENRV